MSRLLRTLGSRVDRRWTSIAHHVTAGAQVLGLRRNYLTLPAATTWRDINEPFIEFPAARLSRGALYFDLEIVLDLPWDESGLYEHSRLHIADGKSDFDIITFRVPKLREVQH